ncbi:alginate lyase family protein [Muriicola sp. E247]|uniref:alginate lyase family protein n=1 Tax=Muriicola sp. E247 TaxID=3242730 RepID=UPI00352693C5
MRYTLFRLGYEIRRKTGLLKSKFPSNPDFLECPLTLDEWRKNAPKFFFEAKESLEIPRIQHPGLQETFNNIQNNTYTFFSRTKLSLGKDFDWITNPVTGYQYELKHWSKIVDLSKEAGDIKYVWEKSRFSFLYDIIRYDYHFDTDCSNLVFREIESFLIHNPINQGPNYRCSQEISLRILNWTFALYYYRNSNELTEERFKSIMNAIYWQLHHVYNNINFSRIAVRNNHALTETLMLFLGGLLFPFLPNTKKWSEKGKKWFQEEIAYQIYEDGTFLQFSMNYHRVAIQLLTWGIKLAELHKDEFNSTVYDRAGKSLNYLRTCQDQTSGKLPNYGANDGALFFKLTDDDYRVYTSQINDLSAVLNREVSEHSESQLWYGIKNCKIVPFEPEVLASYPFGGHYVINDGSSKTLVKCAKYKDRPGHADNLHLDIWVDGNNYLWDLGSYLYNNTEKKYDRFFGYSFGHNTVSVDNKNQMLKGSRFIWNYWNKKAKATLSEKGNSFEFDGQFTGFPELGNKIIHNRKVVKAKKLNQWVVTDTIKNADDYVSQLYWHFNPKTFDQINISCIDGSGNILNPKIEEKWCSNYYGEIEPSIRYTYFSKTGFKTTLKIK